MKASQLTTDYEFVKRCIEHLDNTGEHYESLSIMILLFARKHVIYNNKDTKYTAKGLREKLETLLKVRYEPNRINKRL